jgi:glyoxylase-like metal-dependent hydrolase (beta-lactamase superfamily II)
MRRKLDIPVLGHRGAGGGAYQADRWLEDKDLITVGHHTLRACYTPGHTDDHLCFAIQEDPRILVGDAIFQGGPGKTWSPEDFRTTLETLKMIVLHWPQNTVCFPGHGDGFRLDPIRPAVERFLSKDHGAFCGDAEWDM